MHVSIYILLFVPGPQREKDCMLLRNLKSVFNISSLLVSSAHLWRGGLVSYVQWCDCLFKKFPRNAFVACEACPFKRETLPQRGQNGRFLYQRSHFGIGRVKEHLRIYRS